MRKRKPKILSTILSLALLATSFAPATANAADMSTKMVIASDVIGERTNINFLEGTPGDTHLVYTYQQNGNIYKVVEDSTEDFQNVNSRIYLLNEEGDFIENSTQEVAVNGDGNPEITITSLNGEIEHRTIDISSDKLLYGEAPLVENWEWITEYRDGSKGGLKGLAISVLISVVASVATYYSAGALTSAAVSGASVIATALFNNNSEKVYYHAIYNWRHSPKNYLVIDETEWTEFFLDSSHVYSLGHTYAEYIF